MWLTYRGTSRADWLTRGTKQDRYGLSECTGGRAVLWFGPKKMALPYCRYFYSCSKGVLGQYDLQKILQAAKKQGCDILLLDEEGVALHQLHLQEITKEEGARNFYKKNIFPARQIGLTRLRHAREFAIILPEGDYVLNLSKGTLKIVQGHSVSLRRSRKESSIQRRDEKQRIGQYHEAVLSTSGKLHNPAKERYGKELTRLLTVLGKVHHSHIHVKSSETERSKNQTITNTINSFVKRIKSLQLWLNQQENCQSSSSISTIKLDYSHICEDLMENLNPLLPETEKIWPRNLLETQHRGELHHPEPDHSLSL